MDGRAARVVETDALQDGHTATVRDGDGETVILVGTRPLAPAQEEGRAIVREGLADILAWLGEAVEVPTSSRIIDHLCPVSDDLPTSAIAVDRGTHVFRYLQSGGSDILTEPGRYDTMTVVARRAGATVELPLLDALRNPVVRARALVLAVEDVYREMRKVLAREDFVADVSGGYPLPRLRVELEVKAWPAIRGVTVPEEVTA